MQRKANVICIECYQKNRFLADPDLRLKTRNCPAAPDYETHMAISTTTTFLRQDPLLGLSFRSCFSGIKWFDSVEQRIFRDLTRIGNMADFIHNDLMKTTETHVKHYSSGTVWSTEPLISVIL